MPINVNDPEYLRAEKAFHEATNPEDQLMALNKMISHAPSHKGAENLRQQLTTKRKKLETLIEKKKKKSKKTGKPGIKKEDMQAVIVGKTNVGKSSLMKILTNAETKISDIKFTTNEPIVGMMNYLNTQIQLIEIPAIDGEHFDKSTVHTADTVILLSDKFEDIEPMLDKLYMATGEIIIALNKSDQLNQKEKRKLKAKLESKKYNFEIISCIQNWPENNIEELKKKIFSSFDIIRIYTKEPGKNRMEKPMIMKPNSTVKEAADKIFKGFGSKAKKFKIWGPSSKFGGQIVGPNHILKDLDTLEVKI
jgi:ribosome-interacting GTPase 1